MWRYRCANRVEELVSLGVEADTAAYDRCDLAAAARDYDCFILHRVHWRDRLARFFADTRRQRKPVIYDTDDLMFEPNLAEVVGRRPTMPVERLRTKLEGHLTILRRSDGATVSTQPLADLARAENASVETLVNVASRQMIASAPAGRPAPTGTVTIGYFSGTPTHEHDFAVAADALVRLMTTNSTVRLLVVGPLELDDRFAGFDKRTQRLDLMPREELPGVLASVDVNIAPLAANPFSRCKSCIKYLEAALAGTTTVASRTPDFERVIDHEKNGFLAATPDDWHELLTRLADDADLRTRVGMAAAEDVRRAETTEARAVDHAEKLERLFSGGRPGYRRAGHELARAAARRAAPSRLRKLPRPWR